MPKIWLILNGGVSGDVAIFTIKTVEVHAVKLNTVQLYQSFTINDQHILSKSHEVINLSQTHFLGGTDRITVGIDLWSEPFWTTHNGRRVAIVLMDTQGSFDDHTTMQENAIIFAIATLLSSVLIFNVIRDVGEDVLKFVQFFSSFATLTVPEFEGNAASGELGDGAYQKLLFLVRDFQFLEYYQFGFYDDNHVPNEQQGNYKKDKLDSNPDQPTEMRLTHDQLLKSYKVCRYLNIHG